MKRKIETYLNGTSKKQLSLRSQFSRIIIVCCIAAVCIQAVVMVVLLCRQYVRQERENAKYVLESINEKMNIVFQNVGNMALSIQHNVGLEPFFEDEFYDEEIAVGELKSTATLFAEWNHMGSFEPILEKIYLFNAKEDAIYSLYYPMTLAEIQHSNAAYQVLYKDFKALETDFYVQVEEECLNLCMNLYTSEMKPLGVCIFSLNIRNIEANYKNLEQYDYYSWGIKGGECLYIGNQTFSFENQDYVLMDHSGLGFDLYSYTAISEWGIYHSMWTTIVIVLCISFFVIVVLSFVGYKMAIHYVKPLEIVAEKIDLVGKGNFDTKLGEYSIEELQNISNTFNEMTDYIERLVKEVYETQLVAQQSQIKYLQSQMNPHFLFNVLSMIEMRAALNDDKEVQDMLYKLSKLYQGKIFRKNEYFISLEEEMEIVDFYLSIQNNRFGEKITYSIFYEGEKEVYKNVMVPRLSIEPIVENAVFHGLEPKNGKGHISVNISCINDCLEIYIEDDGVGFDLEKITEKKTGKDHSNVGLWNTNKMIQNLCGDAYGLNIESKIGEGTVVKVVLPVRNGEGYVEGNGCG